MTDSIPSLRDQLLKLKSLHDSGALDAKAYSSAKASLERKLVDLVTSGAPAAEPPPAPRLERKLLAGAAVLVLGIAAAGYWWTGSPGALGVGAQSGPGGESASTAPHALDQAQIATMAEKLAARLKDKPDDAEGWTMLGRSYMVLDKPAEAVAAYERAMKLRPDDAAVMADYADALAVTSGRSLEGEPTRVIERALKVDPDNLKALMLAGTAAFNRSDYAAAVKPWDRMARLGPADNPMVQAAIEGAIEARKRANLPPAAGAVAAAPKPEAPAPKAEAAAASGQAITGTVSLAAALKAKTSPDDTVFIFARPAEGSRMPLAILRKQVKDLPYEFRLDDSLAMSPAATISAAGRVVVGARVSKSGQAMPQPGDLEVLSAPVAVGASAMKLEISSASK